MNFDFTDEQKMLHEMVREFTNAEIKPLACKVNYQEMTIGEKVVKNNGAWKL